MTAPAAALGHTAISMITNMNAITIGMITNRVVTTCCGLQLTGPARGSLVRRTRRYDAVRPGVPFMTSGLCDHGDVLIDTTFDVRRDAAGRDPDTYSATLCRYHRALWSKPLPGGVPFELIPTDRPPYYFRHSSVMGEFVLSSDAFVPAYTRYGVPKSVVDQFPVAEHDQFNAIGYTIGGLILWPANRIDGKWTINQARGCLRNAIGDRMDLTLESIRRHYAGAWSPLGEVLARYDDFFAVFEDFRNYVDFWLLEDMVTDDYGAVQFFTPFEDFGTRAIPQDRDTYLEYRRRSSEFVRARNARIDQLEISSP